MNLIFLFNCIIIIISFTLYYYFYIYSINHFYIYFSFYIIYTFIQYLLNISIYLFVFNHIFYIYFYLFFSCSKKFKEILLKNPWRFQSQLVIVLNNCEHSDHDYDFCHVLAALLLPALILGENNVCLCAEVVRVYAAAPLSRKPGTLQTRLDQKCWILGHDIPPRWCYNYLDELAIKSPRAYLMSVALREPVITRTNGFYVD